MYSVSLSSTSEDDWGACAMFLGSILDVVVPFLIGALEPALKDRESTGDFWYKSSFDQLLVSF